METALVQRIDAYLEGPATLRAVVSGMTRDQLVVRPVPGRWSTLEVVCHLADFEPIYADRMKRVIATERPLVLSAGHEEFAKSLAYHDRDIEEELGIIELTRKQMARILARLSPETLQRESIYRMDGNDEVRTLSRLLELITNHIPHHVQFIQQKRQALGL